MSSNTYSFDAATPDNLEMDARARLVLLQLALEDTLELVKDAVHAIQEPGGLCLGLRPIRQKLEQCAEDARGLERDYEVLNKHYLPCKKPDGWIGDAPNGEQEVAAEFIAAYIECQG